ncbi:MAG: endopeptidase La [Eubacteriales bacterium]
MKQNTLPLVPLRGLIVFPDMTINFDVGRPKSLAAIKKAMSSGKTIILASQKDSTVEDPTTENIQSVGTVAKIKQFGKLGNNVSRVTVEGLFRVKITEYVKDASCFTAVYEEIDTDADIDNDDELKALIRTVTDLFKELANLSKKVSSEVMLKIMQEKSPENLANLISIHGLYQLEDRQKSMQIIDNKERIEDLCKLLNNEIEVVKLGMQINNRVRQQMDKMQKEHYLHEQLKAIKSELGEGDADKAPEQKEMVDALPLDDTYKEKIKKEIDRLSSLPSASPETGMLRTWIDWIFDLPWNESSKDNLDLEIAQKVLDEDHYGLAKVKERIIEYLAVRALTKSMKGPILCFVGPPGVGKTSIGKSIARATDRKFVRMSLGGVRDEAEIRGHRRTYIGSIPGRIVSNIKQAGTNNPVFLLDEIEKMSNDFRGDPASAMLEVLDPEQNSTFTDHYLEVPFDLSQVMFLATANSVDTIPPALFDRMEIIQISGYTDDEKLNIAKKYLLPKQLKEHGMEEKNIKISDSVILEIINAYTREAGVRSLERQFANICRKAAREIVSKKKANLSVTSKNLEQYLGIKKYLPDDTNTEDQIGVATGLAWTSVGGVTLNIEVNVMRGSGKLQLTGQLGDVMKESASAGLSYIRANATELGIPEDNKFYEDKDIHIHIPEGATPKDGPSAGISMATAMLSALTNTPVSAKVAMTGEITLRGKVLPIGGLKAKTLAAYRAGIKKVLIPKENQKDLDEIPEKVKNKIEIVCVSTLEDVLEHALVK